jgi:uncharacterized LabA/DUF88 family protein
MNPYYYLIKHIPSGMYYAGSQYGMKSDPANLLKTYFTSSKYVKQLIEKDGVESFVIEKIDCRPDAREYEQHFLMEMYNELGKELFTQKYLNRNLSPGILLTDEILQKMNGPEKRKKCSESAKKLYENGQHNFQKNVNASKLEHNRKKSSERMKGNDYGSLREMTDELKQKLAEKSKGNTNVRGTIWVMNNQGNRKRVKPNEIPEGYFNVKEKR